MEKLTLLLLTVLMMVGCDERLQDGTYIPYCAPRVYVMDSCEYYGTLGNSDCNFLAHKGNCRFCEERDSIKWEKRREELVEQLSEK